MKNYLHNDTLKLVKKAKNGDREAQNIIVEKNTGLVWSIVRRFQNRGHDIEDIFQIGCIGLIKAIKKFDTSYSVKFSTYAVPMIIGEIKRFLRDDGIIKVSRTLKGIFNKVHVVKEVMYKELGKEPTINQISIRLNIPLEDIVMALEAVSIPESLHNTIGNSSNFSTTVLLDKIDDNTANQEVNIINKIILKQILSSLNNRERQIIILRYFKEKTQVQIAKIFGISQVQVSRIEKKIITRIREKIKYN